MNLKGLEFRNGVSTWGNKYWPSNIECFTDASYVLYVKEKHMIVTGSENSRYWTAPPLYDVMALYPTARPVTDEEMDQFKKRYEATERTSERSKNNRAFDKSVVGDAKLTHDRIFRRYIRNDTAGADTSNRGARISGDTLQYYGGVLAHRIGPNEYLLGPDLTTLASGNIPSHAARFLAFMQLQQGAITWPMAFKRGTGTGWDFSNPFIYVAEYCLKVLTICQLKMPTARDKESYNDIFSDTKDLYNAACRRWGSSNSDTDHLLSIYGDLKVMKEFNASLRMKYEMSK